MVRDRGNTEVLSSDAVRVRVYAGADPVSKRPHYLREVVPPGPKQDAEVRRVKNRMVSDVAERRHPQTSATVGQLLERYLDQFDGAPNTVRLYRGDVKKHIGPFLGHIKVGALDAEMLDSFYAECRRCSEHCDGRPFIQHRTKRPHDCDDRCQPHRCKPLGGATLRHMHYLLSGAYKRAVLCAYGHQCAMCGFAGSLGAKPVGIEAAHVRWHSQHGPDEVRNALALCSLHHVLPDLGVLGLTADRHIRVSELYVARSDAGRAVNALAGRPLLAPQQDRAVVDVAFIDWHDRQVFKVGTSPAA